MTQTINIIKDKIQKTYMKLLKAEIKHKKNKVARLEAKLIQLELEAKVVK